jgi:hypothetical protein
VSHCPPGQRARTAGLWRSLWVTLRPSRSAVGAVGCISARACVHIPNAVSRDKSGCRVVRAADPAGVAGGSQTNDQGLPVAHEPCKARPTIPDAAPTDSVQKSQPCNGGELRIGQRVTANSFRCLRRNATHSR